MGGKPSKIQSEKSSIQPKTITEIEVKPAPSPSLSPPPSPFVKIEGSPAITSETPSGVKRMLHSGFVSPESIMKTANAKKMPKSKIGQPVENNKTKH